MTIINLLVLSTVIGVVLAHAFLRYRRGKSFGYWGFIVGTNLGGATVALIFGPDQTSWYLDGLGFGFLLYWLASRHYF